MQVERHIVIHDSTKDGRVLARTLIRGLPTLQPSASSRSVRTGNRGNDMFQSYSARKSNVPKQIYQTFICKVRSREMVMHTVRNPNYPLAVVSELAVFVRSMGNW